MKWFVPNTPPPGAEQMVARKNRIGHGSLSINTLNATGFTLVELMIVIAIIGTLAAMSVPVYSNALERARVARAIGDIRTIEKDIAAYVVSNDAPPPSLAAIGRGDLEDPWHNLYQYFNYADSKGRGMLRKDKFLVPLNSTYDLYSMGKDGASAAALTAQPSWDDVVRASDGGFVGLATNY